MEGQPGPAPSQAVGSPSQTMPPPLPARPRIASPAAEAMMMSAQAGIGGGVGVAMANMEWRPSAGNPRTTLRRDVAGQSMIRAVTPEPGERHDALGDTSSSSAAAGATQGLPRGLRSMSPQSSPRSMPGGGAGVPGGTMRRQGVVFNDAFAESWDSSSSSPPGRPTSIRPRTHTMDGAYRQQLTSQTAHETRHRVGSFSSAGSLPMNEEARGPAALQPPPESLGHPVVTPSSPPHPQIPASSKDKKHLSRRLIKRASSQPSSPLISPPPSVDSLPLPIPTDDANKVLLLMKTLCGRMRGEIEYQGEPGGPWNSGVCYIDEDRGALMFDPGEKSPFHLPVIPDLRGCRVLPIERSDKDTKCLEIVNTPMGFEVLLRPIVLEEFDLWLAALLCWQQLRPNSAKVSNGRPVITAALVRPGIRRRGSAAGAREASIIKVGKVILWDKGLATNPRAIVKRPSTRDLRSSSTSWRRVSCILQDNGEFKLLTENDVTILSVIELSQLSRCAIQQLDKSVLDEDFCIAIFPIYASTSTKLSIFRPVYIALDTRVLLEVWFVLLRAFTIPDIYSIESTSDDDVVEVTDMESEFSGHVFRVEKTIYLRITEAKLRKPTLDPHAFHDRHAKNDQDVLVGNYLAEVILDGEVRARTTIKADTKNPFWREDWEFTDLPSTLPFLSVVLKKIEGNFDSYSHQLQASLGLPKTGNLTEILCGCVDINLNHLERGKDHEQWLQIFDERQQAMGQMLLKVHHEEHAVLLSKDYQPMSELLHKFSTGVTAQISDALPGQLRRLAEVFLNIFQVSGSASDWLMALVEDEIDGIGNQTAMKKMRFSRRLRSNESMESASEREAMVRDMGRSLAGEANLLFRGNSLLTQALEFHMRRLGKEYLEEVLADKILEINEINPNCEVDPSKLQHGDDLNQHWTQLLHLTVEVWDCIAASASRFPAELRHILKYIRAVAEDRYGDFLRTVSYTSISGFLFLRFICPAVLNPKLFGLLRDHPRPRAQRTLTLIAKGLQALANLSTIGKKETWMEPMNKFLTVQRQSVKAFIDQVCAISVERSTVPVPASYSTPITILGRLSPPMREGFPSLPYLIDHARSFSALVKIWMDANPVSRPGSRVLDGDLLQFNDICVKLETRAAECYAKVEDARAAAAESASLAGDDLTDALEHASLVDTVNMSYGSSAAWTDHDGSLLPPGSSGSEMDSNYGSQRWGREAAGSNRQVSGSSELSAQCGTVRSLRNGKQARKFLSGFMRGSKGRTASPDAGAGASSPAPTRDKDRDKGRVNLPES